METELRSELQRTSIGLQGDSKVMGHKQSMNYVQYNVMKSTQIPPRLSCNKGSCN